MFCTCSKEKIKMYVREISCGMARTGIDLSPLTILICRSVQIYSLISVTAS